MTGVYASAEKVQELLERSLPDGSEMLTHPLPDGEAPVLQIMKLSHDAAAETLDRLQQIAGQTNRWPLLCLHRAEPYTFPERQFRHYVDEGDTVTPSAIAERSLSIDVDQYILDVEEGREEYLLDNFVDLVEEEPQQFYLPDELDPGPQVHEELQTAIDDGKISTATQARQWIFDWRISYLDNSAEEIAQFRRDHLDYQEEEDPNPYRKPDGQILLYPVTKAESWRATTFEPWFNRSGEFTSALLRRWSDRWGAVLVSHNGLSMRFIVDNPPETLSDAAVLAREHFSLAPGTTELPCVDLALYARALIGHPRWHLFDKP